MASFHVIADAAGIHERPTVRRITNADLFEALRQGAQDFWAKPSHYVFLCLIYPIMGIVLTQWSSGSNMFQLIYPLVSGFALIGPFAAIGLYEISRRREQGLDSSWSHALDVRHSPALPSIGLLGVMLFALFLLWMYAAQAIYASLYGDMPPTSIGSFLQDALTTQRGWTLIVLGNLTGLVFAFVVLATTVIAFPLLLDRDVGAFTAIETSVKAMLVNPAQMIFWGIIVAALLVLGSIPIFAGLAIVMPILGHATWHLYRKVIEPQNAARRPM
jgi:uncharacterized membrane protein